MSNNNQIPTAYEFLHRDESGVFNEVDITQAMDEYAKLHVEQIKQFLYSEICERREYSASRMCEEVLKFIEQMSNEQDVERVRIIGDKIIITPSGNVGIGSSARWRGDNNIPDTDNNTTGENNNTSTTGNISTIWGGDTSSTTENISNTWGSYRLNVTGTKTEDDNRIAMEKKLWDKTVHWDRNNTVNDEEQAPYKVTTTVSKPNKTDDGTLAVIEITIGIKQR
jgi:hypothetical protein